MSQALLAKQLRCLEKQANCSFDAHPKILGEGSFGIVVQGTYVGAKPSRPVAVKIAKPSASRQKENNAALQNELKMLNKLSPVKRPHPHIVTMIYGGTLVHDKSDLRISSMILELCREGTLLDHITEDRLPLPRLEILFQICVGLAYVHAQGIYHCDLKPGNILLQYEPGKGYLYKIADFGSALDQLWAHPQDVVGTQVYMPPEMAWSVKPINLAKVDVFSVGVILYQLLTGCYPWLEDHSKASALNQHLWKSSVPSLFKPFFTAIWSCAPQHRENANQLKERARLLLAAKK